MPDRTTDDESDQLDHSSHPTGHRLNTDLRSPSGGSLAHPEGRRRDAIQEREAEAAQAEPESTNRR